MASSTHIPHLQQYENTKQLVVNGKPYLMLGGELQNSSLSSAEFMSEVWPKMVATNVNTLLGSVSWEMIEPEEGNFDFEELDKVILGAREHGLHLVLLWFGSFKNGRSTYAPAWVKTNPERFPRAELRKAGGVMEVADVLSLFYEESVEADAKAFRKLLAHIREVDEKHSTVLMVQVENEVGLLFDSRDGSAKANSVFAEPVPKDLLKFLEEEYDNLHADLKANLKTFVAQSKPQSGSWEEVFGKSNRTDELFMAYHYAHYVDRVAAAGKAEYPIPLYTNVWQNYAGEDADNETPTVVGGGGQPGDYPSGGGTTNVLDIWLRFAPNLEFIAPDIYLNEYTTLCDKYRHGRNSLFIPEQRRDEYGVRRIWIAYGTFQALLASPFGIDTLEPESNPFTKHYGLLAQVSQLVLDAQRKPGSSVGFCFDKISGDKDLSKPIRQRFGEWDITIERAFVFGKPDTGSGMVIHCGGARFLLIGWGFQVTGQSTKSGTRFNGILRNEEKVVEDVATGKLRTLRTLGGDETRSGASAVMPNEDPDYGGFPIAITIPARTGIAEVEFYSF
ncbi:glycoside hydrolase family 35 protein [Bipolaris maydis ATCC 48331]|uniref:Glycoside hydrolase family 35 protein n=2 Tax=Cochliobolus heterostrophus TaxID=5016 RepID=M2T499_COCH5|nr:glycoside hydrolase family 35 protein [Bipolaris maydis ATCC 48331]EMD92385.1 glycoside hydrolase family 35 protein [Bipolaris maydis C5]KAH7550989.1 glycoside hydrolase family 35 protein [Bipolaris maydis]ENI08076.1 glycoside hydrolase family 35 protein [Bipolaris maydis ATCC 48331]KAJ5022217.1 glycoside hydrolase [Bipolaris maydis]KAJ5060909.1 glycoside hydrolase superfamily [Bipolaris maydis]